MGYCLFLRIVKTCAGAKRATDKAVEVSTNFEWFAKFNRVGFELVDKKNAAAGHKNSEVRTCKLFFL